MDRKGPAGQKPRQIAADSRWRESAAGIPAHNLIMALPWLRIIDAALGVTDLMRGRRGRGFAADEESQQLAPGAAIGGLETRLAGVVVAALKEAFDRDTRRLQLEREQLEAERRRAERALQLELLRQAGDRELGRLRLLAGAALASWIGTLFFSGRLLGGSLAPRFMLGGGWILLLGAIAGSFAAQSRVARALQDAGEDPSALRSGATSTVAGDLAPWMIVCGLALVGLAVLIA